MAIEKPTTRNRKQTIVEGKTYYAGHPDLMTPEQMQFDVVAVIEKVVGTVVLDKGGYGITPTVAAFEHIAKFVEQQPRGTGEEVEINFRFHTAGGMHNVTVHVI